MQTLTPLASEGRIHLTANGAVSLCGRAITHKWRRRPYADDHDCGQCRDQAAEIGPVHVAPRLEGVADDAHRAAPG